MTLFGKDMGEVNVVAADFLPDGKRLYMLVADEDSNLHVLQYDPEGNDWRFNCVIGEELTNAVFNRP